MHPNPVADHPPQDARDAGSIMAQAVRCARDLESCAEEHPGLFAARPFDSTLYHAVACANAFGSPGVPAAGLRVAGRTSLWIFALDWLVDHIAATRAEIDDITRRCLAVADGAAPADGDELARFLAEIRDELALAPGFTDLRADWRRQLRRLLDAGAREWSWKSGAAPRPSFAEYLDNADNYGSAWVNISHWIASGAPQVVAHREALQAASREVQRVLRLLNDLATYERDVTWGDLNALMLGVDRSEVTAHLDLLVERCHRLIEPIRSAHPEAAVYLERQIGYSTGFYGITDYWGTL
ncbi:terpene synthase family protein [Actinomadura fulvescens]|uniref:Terpene synthase n=1 Tax=Actinomadura fulvescens TaxID=46160 RepID=A0ABN3PY72_9ACTN